MPVESRGACWKCGSEVTTVHVRCKDAHGRYAHVDCGAPLPGGASAEATAAIAEGAEECYAYTAKKKRRRGGEGGRGAFHDAGVGGAAAAAAGVHDTAIVIRDSDEESGGRRPLPPAPQPRDAVGAWRRDARGAGMATSPGRMNIYDQPPRGAMPLHEFEEYALDRLHVLKGFDVGKVCVFPTHPLHRVSPSRPPSPAAPR